MSLNVAREQAALQRMTVKALRTRFAEVFGEPTNAANKVWLIKRILWRLQAIAEGGLSERARKRAEALARDEDLRLNAPREQNPAVLPLMPPTEQATQQTIPLHRDERLPAPGTTITRKYKGEVLQVKVLANGFEYEGEIYPSLSAVARRITGSHLNGMAFFKLGGNGGKS